MKIFWISLVEKLAALAVAAFALHLGAYGCAVTALIAAIFI